MMHEVEKFMGIIERLEVDEATMRQLERDARRHGRSVQHEAAERLRAAFRHASKNEIVARLEAVAAMTPTGVVQTDSALLIREDRDR